MRSNGISVISNRRHISLPTEDILYIQLAGRRAVIHASGGRTYETYTTIEELEQMLGSMSCSSGFFSSLASASLA